MVMAIPSSSAAPSPTQSRKKGEKGQNEGRLENVGVVALVLLAEAHPAVAVSLRHARVVHDEEVHLEVVRARPLDLVVL